MFALPFMMVSPMDTWPSPPRATMSPRRIDSIVVPLITSDSGEGEEGFQPTGRFLAMRLASACCQQIEVSGSKTNKLSGLSRGRTGKALTSAPRFKFSPPIRPGLGRRGLAGLSMLCPRRRNPDIEEARWAKGGQPHGDPAYAATGRSSAKRSPPGPYRASLRGPCHTDSAPSAWRRTFTLAST